MTDLAFSDFYSIPHLSVSGTSPPTASSPLPKVKSEPMSPRQLSVNNPADIQRQDNNHLSPVNISNTGRELKRERGKGKEKEERV